jgi:dihydrofolate reductase
MLTRNPASVKIGDFPTLNQDGRWYVDGGEKWQIEIYTSKEELEFAVVNEENVLILWGSEIYQLFLDDPRSEIRLSEIHKEYDGDAYFPDFQDLYIEISRENKGEFDLVWYTRKK